MTAELASPPATRLCAACGLCCDGTLFHSVILQPDDSARALAALGLKIKRRKGVAYFYQPCRAHDGSRCAIYEQRPQRCRVFRCQQLRRVEAGEISEDAARGVIGEARARVAGVRALLDEVAETNPRRALAHRVANATTGASAGPVAALRTAMGELEQMLDREFRVEMP